MLLKLRNMLFRSNGSKKRAKSRLHFVLVQDRTGLSAEDLAEFRGKLVDVIEEYFVIDKQGFDVSYKREEESTMLLINSPVLIRRQESPGGKVGSRHKQSAVKQSGGKKSRSTDQSQPLPAT